MPSYLVGSTSISFSTQEKLNKKSNLIEFKLLKDSVVIIYRDLQLLTPPMKWIEELKFCSVCEKLLTQRLLLLLLLSLNIYYDYVHILPLLLLLLLLLYVYRINKGYVEQIFYTGYGKFYKEGSVVSLGGNTSYDTSPTSMYTLVIVPTDINTPKLGDLIQQVKFGQHEGDTISSSSSSLSSSSRESYALWSDGHFGLAVFSTTDDKFKVGVKRGTLW